MPTTLFNFRLFLAGIMQGSLLGSEMHSQDYRGELRELLRRELPEADVYDPLVDHQDSVSYDDERGRLVFFGHNRLCRDVDVVLAFVPQASMGTAIEMWEAHQAGKIVIAVSPMDRNWAVRFLSHRLYATVNDLAGALASGELRDWLAGQLPRTS